MERTACCDDLMDLDKYAEQNWKASKDYAFGNHLVGLTGDADHLVEGILQTGRNWEDELCAREAVRKGWTEAHAMMLNHLFLYCTCACIPV